MKYPLSNPLPSDIPMIFGPWPENPELCASQARDGGDDKAERNGWGRTLRNPPSDPALRQVEIRNAGKPTMVTTRIERR
jgi:hypothetical protein